MAQRTEAGYRIVMDHLKDGEMLKNAQIKIYARGNTGISIMQRDEFIKSRYRYVELISITEKARQIC